MVTLAVRRTQVRRTQPIGAAVAVTAMASTAQPDGSIGDGPHLGRSARLAAALAESRRSRPILRIPSGGPMSASFAVL